MFRRSSCLLEPCRAPRVQGVGSPLPSFLLQTSFCCDPWAVAPCGAAATKQIFSAASYQGEIYQQNPLSGSCSPFPRGMALSGAAGSCAFCSVLQGCATWVPARVKSPASVPQPELQGQGAAQKASGRLVFVLREADGADPGSPEDQGYGYKRISLTVSALISGNCCLLRSEHDVLPSPLLTDSFAVCVRFGSFSAGGSGRQKSFVFAGSLRARWHSWLL